MKFPKKSLGQNFLVDRNIIKKIITTTQLENKNVFEIGPGRGALTEEILKKNPKSLFLIEKDFELAQLLKEKYNLNKNIKIYNNDILKIDVEKILEKKTIIIGNLPYNISSQILIKFIKFKKWPPMFSDLIFMFQKELGEKIIGKFGSKNYGRISILTNLRLKLLKKFFISANCFRPKPKVSSVVLHLKPKKMHFNISNISILENITQTLFSNKRKMINKNIKKILKKKQIAQIKNLRPDSRPSEIVPEIYYRITELVEKN